jgi:hypothetical protein
MMKKGGMKEFWKAPIFIKRQAAQMLCVNSYWNVVGDDRRPAAGSHDCYQ